MNDLSGQTIKGYELKERIGAGGFGAVYRAYQPLLKREVAVKVILPQHANQPEFIRRFEVEAELVARLEHPHIIPLFDYWREPDGAYLVMRWLRGGSLRDDLKNNGAWDVEHILHLLEHITAALHVAHRNGVVHRDIKPDNILLDEDGNAYLADFGIAKSPGKESKSGDSGVTGSVMYASPEQLQSQAVSPQTDIYSLGIVIYEMLKGEHPFGNPTLSELIFKHLKDPFPELQLPDSSLTGAINEILQKATAKDPADRFADVREVAGAFREAITGEAIVIETHAADLYEDVELDNPYKGLRAFQEYDSDDFFGREALTERLLSRLSEEEQIARFLAVVGPSGSGKSSVIKAGMIPAVRRATGKWFITEMFPGAHPFAELEAALLRVAVNAPSNFLETLKGEQGILRGIKQILPPEEDRELLLIIDQFEELFTLTDDEELRVQFLDGLLDALEDPRSRLRVIVTLRADFYDKPLQYLDFGEVLRRRTEIVLPLSPDELQTSIVKPAEQAGAQFEAGLVQAIITEIGEQPGILPLLQYALTELFERRQGRMLTRQAYNDIGGVIGALARRAEEIYTKLDEIQQEASHQLFMRLVTLGEGTEDTRRRVKLSELSLADTSVMDKYGNARLLTFDRDPVTRGPTVEVAHEALIRTWERLKEWVADSRDDLRTHRHLTQMTAEWVQHDRDSGFLAQAAHLSLFESWSQETKLALNEDERAYLEASIEQREERRRVDEARKEREINLQKQSAQRLRYLAIVLAISTVGAILLSLFAFNAQRQANDDANRASTAQQQAEEDANRASTAEQRANEDANRASTAERDALISKATEISQGNEAILNAMTATIALGISEQQGTQIAEQAATSDASLVEQWRTQALFLTNLARQELDRGAWSNALNLALQSLEHRDRFVLEQSHQVLSDVLAAPGQERAFYPYTQTSYMAWNNDGTHFLVGNSNIMYIVDAVTGTTLADVNYVRGVSGDVDPVVYESFGDKLVVVDTRDIEFFGFEEEHLPITVGAEDINLWSHDRSSYLDGVDWEHDLSVIDASTFLPRFELRHPEQVEGAHWKSDDSQILSYSDDGTVFVWDAATGEQLFLLRHPDDIEGAVWNADETRIATWDTRESFVYIWDAETGEPLHTIDQMDDVEWAGWSNTSNQILVQSRREIRIWNAETGEEVLTLGLGEQDNPLQGTSRSFDGAIWNNDDSLILTVSYLSGNCTNDCQHEIRIWDATTGLLLHRLQHEDRIDDVKWNDDETLILSWAEDKTVRIWDATTGELYLTLRHNVNVHDVVWNPDESNVLVSSQHGIHIWDSVPASVRHTDTVNGAVWNADETQVLSWSDDNTARIWDAETGQQEMLFQHEQGFIFSEVSSATWNADESKVLTAGWDFRVRVWNVETGEQLLELAHGSTVHSAQWNADETRILTWVTGDVARIWDAETGEEIHEFQTRKDFYNYGGTFEPIWSRDESKLLTLSNSSNDCEENCDHKIIVWDTSTGEQLTVIAVENKHINDPTRSNNINSIMWNADETQIMGRSANIVYLWDSASGDELLKLEHIKTIESQSSTSSDGPTPTPLPPQTTKVTSTLWNADETQVMTLTDDNYLRIWDASTGALILDIETGERITDIRWSHNENRILARLYDGVRVFDATSGESIHSIESFRMTRISGGSWSADEQRILVWGEKVAIWDVATGTNLISLSDDGEIRRAIWSADESRVLAWTTTGKIRVWTVDIESLIQTAKERQLRDLNNGERLQYFLPTLPPTATNLPPTATVSPTPWVASTATPYTYNTSPPSTPLPTITIPPTPTLDIPFTPIIPGYFDGLDLASSVQVQSIDANEIFGEINPWGDGIVNIVAYSGIVANVDTYGVRLLTIAEGLSTYSTLEEWIAEQSDLTELLGREEDTDILTASIQTLNIEGVEVLETLLITPDTRRAQYFFIMGDVFIVVVDDGGDNAIQLVEMLITGAEFPILPTATPLLTPSNTPQPSRTPLPTLTISPTPTLDIPFTPIIPGDFDGFDLAGSATTTTLEPDTMPWNPWGDEAVNVVRYVGSTLDRTIVVIEGESAYTTITEWLEKADVLDDIGKTEEAGEATFTSSIIDIEGSEVLEVIGLMDASSMYQYFFIKDGIFIAIVDAGGDNAIELAESLITGEKLPTSTPISTPTLTPTATPMLSFAPIMPDTSGIDGQVDTAVYDTANVMAESSASPFTGDFVWVMIITQGDAIVRLGGVIEGLSAYDSLDDWLSEVNLAEVLGVDNKVGVTISLEVLNINGVNVAKATAIDNNETNIQYYFIINDLFVMVFGSEEHASIALQLIESIITQANE